MQRSQRLLDLIHLLLQHRHPVTGAQLAQEMGVSLRTLYRDIDSLRQMGAAIDGEAGLGYVLRDGFILPPLMLQDEELEALCLGIQWVAKQGDEALAAAARQALAKITAVLPSAARERMQAPLPLMVAQNPIDPENGFHLPTIRKAIRTERKLHITYQDGTGQSSERTIWPFLVGFFNQSQVVAAWCELRQEYRHFRADRVLSTQIAEERYPRRRHDLRRDWHLSQGIPLP